MAAGDHDGVRTCVFAVYDGFQLLDLAGPLEVLRSATRLGADPGYRTVVASVDGAAVRSESGVQIVADASLQTLATARARAREALDTLVIVGGNGVAQACDDERLVASVARLSGRAARTVSVCTGAFVLGRAGVLDGRQATTHWASCDRLAAIHPATDVVADRIFVRDRDVWTSAGVTAGIDLALALVEDDHGRELAHAVARWLVVFARRPGGQAQFSAQLRAQPARSAPIAEVQHWIGEHLADDLTVEALARRAAMSTRSFARAFRAETGTTPAAYVESVRVEAARRLLETSELAVAAVARAVGFRRAETLHRAFRRKVGTTPEQYRRHFGMRAS